MPTVTAEQVNRRIDHGLALFAERGITAAEVREHVLDMMAYRRDDDERILFDVNDCNACVLAAVYGSFAEGLGTLGINEADAVLFGFDPGRGNCAAVEELNRQWRIRLGLEEAA